MALVAAFGMAGGSIAFEIAGKKIGSLTVNMLRLIQGMFFLSITSLYMRGMPLPTDASLKEYTFLGISGFIGMFLGDLFMFESFVLLGARITTLIMTTVPVVTAIVAWVLLGETLSFKEGIAVFLTIGGIFLVMFYGNKKGETKEKFPIKGIFCAIGGVLGQSLGLVFSKIGLESYDPIAATQIRVIVATIAFIILISIKRKWGEIKKGAKNKRAIKWVVAGSFLGPFIGVTAMLIALKNTSTGIVSTLSSTSPILIIPFCVLILKERIKPIEILGAIISVGGASLFFI
ncbi:MAG: DMT family transporter [Psychrilyobacter sp.]|uniref:DMT family transporter n=1 Tax=Psychrilyobacter sp. TaxID=2586924 RepID=UPI003C746FFE